jgi:cytidylate kinase
MIVAIGRELGAGGREIGERVAAALGSELLDNQIVDLVAARIGAPTAYVQERDEHVEGFADRLFRLITAAYPESLGTTDMPDWSEERLVKLTATIIEERSTQASLVVMGRGAPMLLKDRSDALRVFVTAPLAARVKRLQERLDYSKETAEREIRKSDQHRSAYMQQYYRTQWQDPHNYDLVLNTARIGVAGAAELIARCAQRLQRPANGQNV